MLIVIAKNYLPKVIHHLPKIVLTITILMMLYYFFGLSLIGFYVEHFHTGDTLGYLFLYAGLYAVSLYSLLRSRGQTP